MSRDVAGGEVLAADVVAAAQRGQIRDRVNPAQRQRVRLGADAKARDCGRGLGVRERLRGRLDDVDAQPRPGARIRGRGPAGRS
jgi:hypothetical protein